MEPYIPNEYEQAEMQNFGNSPISSNSFLSFLSKALGSGFHSVFSIASEAQSLCGHLVTINDEDEKNWVWETFAPLIGGLLWIGLNDAEQEGMFV